MGLEVGSVVEGKVTGITKFGAFVDLQDGKTGMVHISEVAPTYVNDINDFLKEGQSVKVKILSIGDDGKISLSIKKAVPPAKKKTPYQQSKPGSGAPARPGNFDWQSSKRSEPSSFEDMLSKFKQTSDEKMSDLKRMNESKRGGYSRRGNSQKQ